MGQGCVSCHFGEEPVEPSPALALDSDRRDGAFALTLRFASDAPAGGFLIAAETAEGKPAGHFAATDTGTDADGHLARSIAPAKAPAAWPLVWHPPAQAAEVVFRIQAVAGSGDVSPFGDTVHRKTIRLRP